MRRPLERDRVAAGERQLDVRRRLAAHERERRAPAAEVHALGQLARDVDAGHRLELRACRVEVGHADPEVVDDVAAGRALVAHRLGAVAVGVQQERAVVLGRVDRPWAGRTVVAVAGVDAGLPEALDVLARRRDEADVQATCRSARSRERERSPVVVSEDRQQRRVEAHRRREVAHADGHTLEHDQRPSL
jgi:hypothetical protein